jgi:hypothetical protein
MKIGKVSPVLEQFKNITHSNIFLRDELTPAGANIFHHPLVYNLQLV